MTWPWQGAWPPLSPPRPSGESRELKATAPLLDLPSQAWYGPQTVFFLSHFQDPPLVKILTTFIGRLPASPACGLWLQELPYLATDPQDSYQHWCPEQLWPWGPWLPPYLWEH